jgi:hypothetical protein
VAWALGFSEKPSVFAADNLRLVSLDWSGIRIAPRISHLELLQESAWATAGVLQGFMIDSYPSNICSHPRFFREIMRWIGRMCDLTNAGVSNIKLFFQLQSLYPGVRLLLTGRRKCSLTPKESLEPNPWGSSWQGI